MTWTEILKRAFTELSGTPTDTIRLPDRKSHYGFWQQVLERANWFYNSMRAPEDFPAVLKNEIAQERRYIVTDEVIAIFHKSNLPREFRGFLHLYDHIKRQPNVDMCNDALNVYLWSYKKPDTPTSKYVISIGYLKLKALEELEDLRLSEHEYRIVRDWHYAYRPMGGYAESETVIDKIQYITDFGK